MRSILRKQVDSYARLFDIARDKLPDAAVITIHEGDCFPAANLSVFRSDYGAELLYQGYGEEGGQFWVFRRNNQLDVLAKRGDRICVSFLGQDGGDFEVVYFDKETALMIASFIGIAVFAFGYKLGSMPLTKSRRHT